MIDSNGRIATVNALLDGLLTGPDGRLLPPKTANGALPARSTPEGWGWTHYFHLADGSVVGHKLPDNMTFINRWTTERYGPDVVHLGRAIPDPQSGEFRFEPWAFPLWSVDDRDETPDRIVSWNLSGEKREER